MNIPAEKRAMMADLKRYALENYGVVRGMDYVVESFDEMDLVIIVNKSKGDFAKAIEILKKQAADIADYDDEIASTAF